MKKILLSLTTLLFLFTTSAYSVTLTVKDLSGKPGAKIEIQETDSVRVEQIVVPENEKWMVDRVLKQNSELNEGDISRVEYSFGVYYGQINKSNVANGKGILGVRDDDAIDVVPGDNEVNTYYGIETTFKNGKLGKKSEQTILTDSGGKALEAKENIADQIKFHNQAFNNGFKIKADLVQLLSNDLVNTITSLSDDIKTILSLDFSKLESSDGIYESLLSIEDFHEIKDGFNSVQDYITALAEGEKLMDDSSYDRMLYDFESIYFRLERQIYKFTNIKELLSTDTAYPGSKVINLGDILRDAVLSSHIGRLVDLKSKTIKAYQLLTQPEMIGLLTFQQSNLDLLENINTLGSTKSFLNKDKNFKEVRIVDGYNMRKNTSGTTIEAKGSNGTWYLVEYVLNDNNTFTLQLTDEGKKNYENDKKALQTGSSDSSSSSSSSGSGGGEGGGS